MASTSLSYADAGVNIPVWNAARKRIGKLVESTFNKNVVGKFGHFGGMFSIASLKSYKRPILVSSVDGVGTKLKIAAETGIHHTVGMDIVNHCINDILVLGAKPLYFLDYIATGKLEPDVFVKVLSGLTKACRAADCVLIGGETAEMPGMYQAGEYDIAGTIVGVVDEKDVIDGSKIRRGDVLIGLHVQRPAHQRIQPCAENRQGRCEEIVFRRVPGNGPHVRRRAAAAAPAVFPGAFAHEARPYSRVRAHHGRRIYRQRRPYSAFKMRCRNRLQNLDPRCDFHVDAETGQGGEPRDVPDV